MTANAHLFAAITAIARRAPKTLSRSFLSSLSFSLRYIYIYLSGRARGYLSSRLKRKKKEKKTRPLYSRTRSASYFHTCDRTLQLCFPRVCMCVCVYVWVGCQFCGTEPRGDEALHVVLSKIITSASSARHGIGAARQGYVDQNWLDRVA